MTTRQTTGNIEADQVQAYLDAGLRNYWHPVAPGWQVNNAPVGLTRLGEQIVLWRDQDGKVHALEDRCPHRGARRHGGVLVSRGAGQRRWCGAEGAGSGCLSAGG
jgi:hypothetical protein